MLDAAWGTAWLAGWIVWLFFGWWTLVQSRAFVAEGASVLRRVNPVRSVACTWAVLLFALFSGVGRLHLIWIGPLITYAPPVLSSRALRDIGISHGVLGYVLGFIGIAAVSGMAAWDIAEMVGLHIAAYHVLLFAFGGGTALWFRRNFWKALQGAEETLTSPGNASAGPSLYGGPEDAATQGAPMDDQAPPDESEDGESLTPELIGTWLVGEQRTSFQALLAAAQGHHPEVPPLDPSVEAMTEMAVHSYALHLSIVCVTYQPMLDDSQFLSGSEGGDVDISTFVARIHSGAREEAKKFIILKDPAFEPFAVAGCVLELNAVMPHILAYYSAFFAPLDSFDFLPAEAVRYAKAMVQQMDTTSPIAPPAALAYYFGFQELFTDGGRPQSLGPSRVPITRSAGVILRTWPAWVDHTVGFQRKLITFHGKREVAFA